MMMIMHINENKLIPSESKECKMNCTQEENNGVDKHNAQSDETEVDSQILEDFVAVDNRGLESNGKKNLSAIFN